MRERDTGWGESKRGLGVVKSLAFGRGKAISGKKNTF